MIQEIIYHSLFMVQSQIYTTGNCQKKDIMQVLIDSHDSKVKNL